MMPDTPFHEVLAYCNDVRKRLGLDQVDAMQKGWPGTPRNCPVANTIRLGTGYKIEIGSFRMYAYEPLSPGVLNSHPRIREQLPKYIKDFVRGFDYGYTPEHRALDINA